MVFFRLLLELISDFVTKDLRPLHDLFFKVLYLLVVSFPLRLADLKLSSFVFNTVFNPSTHFIQFIFIFLLEFL